ncbi:MAG: ThuA domain-containing protein [Spirochaetales bacterium]
MPELLIFGRTEGAPYHPLEPLKDDLLSLFGGKQQAECTESPGRLNDLATSGVKTLVALDDNWNEPLDVTALFSVERWVRKGGNLLVIHNGICWARHRRWKSLAAASFVGHEPAKLLTFGRPDGTHFELFEEPYRFSFARGKAKTVLATYRDEGKDWPAAWFCPVGKGRITYALPGHFPTAFQVPLYRNWLKEWATPAPDEGASL